VIQTAEATHKSVERFQARDNTHRARVLLADDHQMVADSLREILEQEFDVVGVVADGRAMVEAALKLRPDVVVADISMPELNGIEAMQELKKKHSKARVVFLTMHRDVAYANRALEAGALGYVLKHSAPMELIASIRAALENHTFITPSLAGEVLDAARRGSDAGGDTLGSLTLRQREILQLLAEGHSAKEIGKQLAISARTVEFHKYRMMESLRLTNSAELIHYAIKSGIVTI
jgi:DNA-binding NarL/FixJ family response regulator